jgi:hypothetical protein
MAKTKKRRCGYCRKTFITSDTGRAPRYCGNACRQAAYRRRVQKRPNDPSRLLALDIAEYRFRSQLRRRLGNPEFRAYLLSELQMTVTETAAPLDPSPPPRRPPRSRPQLRIVAPIEAPERARARARDEILRSRPGYAACAEWRPVDLLPQPYPRERFVVRRPLSALRINQPSCGRLPELPSV